MTDETTDPKEHAECNCVIEKLLETPFSSLNFEERKEMVAKGRPKCDLPNLLQPRKNGGKIIKLKFYTSKYESIPWLCGCSKLSRLFCWPCLLFNKSSTTKWNTEGVVDLNNLGNVTRQRHEEGKEHITASVCLKEFMRVLHKDKIDFSKGGYAQKNEAHNRKVKSNRYVIQKLIDATGFLAQQAVAFRGLETSENSPNNYLELLHLQAKSDAQLREHLEKCTVLSNDDPTIYNDLVESCTKYLMQQIKKEVSEAKFVALITEETIDAAKQPVLTNVLRYVDSHGVVRERFTGFLDVSDDGTVDCLLKSISDLTVEFKCEDKLVAQTYDGASVSSGEFSALVEKVKSKCPQALLMHCYLQRLILVFQSCTKHINSCEIFFKTLTGLVSFFSHLSKRSQELSQIVNTCFPSIAPDKWVHQNPLLQLVHEERRNLIKLLQSVVTIETMLDGETRCCAVGFHEKLHDFRFNFLLKTFCLVWPKAQALFEILQAETSDFHLCCTEIENFKEFLLGTRENFDEIWTSFRQGWKKTENLETETEDLKTEISRQIDNGVCVKVEPEDSENEEETEVPRKRMRTDDGDMDYRHLFNDVIDALSSHLTERFADFKHLEFSQLLNFQKFKEYDERFPTDNLKSLINSPYGKNFKETALQNELDYAYSSLNFKKRSISELQDYSASLDLMDTLPELTKLLILIQTIPVTCAVANSSSTLKRIRNYTKSTTGQDRLNGLSLLSIEKNLFKDLENNVRFYDDIIDIFAGMKERRFKLEFK